jgi:predicted nucleic acid-binding protein
VKVVVDTCVWSFSLRRASQAKLNPEEVKASDELRDAIRGRRAVILGSIRQEILSGIRDKARFARTEGLLDPFPNEEIKPEDYVQAARLFNLCRDHGVECGPVDILICSVAIRNSYGILTTDQGLTRCIRALQAEGYVL